MDKEQAKSLAARAEALADQIETPEHGVSLAADIAALLLCGDGHKSRVSEKANMACIVKDDGTLPVIPKPWAGKSRGVLADDFMTNPVAAIALVERVFPDWGYDTIKWPNTTAMTSPPTLAMDKDGNPLPVFDAEVTPPYPVDGHSLIGQHTTFAGALLAAALRGYAFKVKRDAGVLDMPKLGNLGDVDLDSTDQERGWIHDIAERAEELGLIDGEARLSLMMDVAATHRNGCPLRLEHLLHETTDFDFAHDVMGIRDNIDRTTGKLQHEFLPRSGAEMPESTVTSSFEENIETTPVDEFVNPAKG